jgi:hypothetical protein
MNLLDFRYDKYTTTGNDGIIEKIFDILKIKDGYFVEFGAWDGIKGSNCRKLYEEGWSGIFIEPVGDRFADLKVNYQNDTNIVCINSVVDRDNHRFDDLVRPHVKGNIDFCSIDIDGLDLEIFESFEEFMPEVVCIEGGQMLQPDHKRVPESVASDNIQQSLKVMCDSFQKKGYKPICSQQDTFFVKEKYIDLFDTPRQIMDLYLDGIYSHHRRLPWIKYMIERNGLKNVIVNYVLQNSNYYKYGYHRRKEWAVAEKELTLSVIKSLSVRFKNRENSKQ